MRRRGDGKAAAPAAWQHDVDVLAGLEVEGFRRRQPQVQPITSCERGTARSMRAGRRLS